MHEKMAYRQMIHCGITMLQQVCNFADRIKDVHLRVSIRGKLDSIIEGLREIEELLMIPMDTSI